MSFLFILALLDVVPIILCYRICELRHRSVAKGVVLALLFGWLAVLMLWLALKRRNRQTMMLY